MTGSKLLSAADHQNLRKILDLFANVRSLNLKGTGIKDLGLIGEILCTKFLRCKRLDLTGHGATKTDMARLVDILEGRSLTKDVAPFWLIVGDGMQELLTADTGCDHNTGDGCKCRSKRVVHVLATLRATPSTATVGGPARKVMPPLPKESPPPSSLKDIVVCAEHFATARRRLKASIEFERERGRTFLRGGFEYVLVACRNKLALVDFTSLEHGTVLDVGGTQLRIEDVERVPGEDGIIHVRAEAYHVGGNECATPESYLRTQGGDPITIRIGDFTAGGWVAATHSDRHDWKWFPLHKCLV